jgi:spore maturation protein CgeB
MNMKVLVCGHEHFGYVKSIARGFQQLDHVESDSFTHPYAPVRKMRAGPRVKRFWHGMQTTKINRIILERVEAGEYDLVLCIEGTTMLPETVTKIRQKSKIALWCLDSLKLLNLDLDILKAFTRVFFFEPTDAKIFPEGSYLPIGFDDTVYRRLNSRKFVHDLIWIGSPHKDRLPKLDRIARFAKGRGMDFRIYSRFYSKKKQRRELEIHYPYLFQAIRRNARILPTEANLLYGVSRIGINLHLSDFHSQGINPRTLEVPGSGCFLLTDYRSEIERMFHIDSEVSIFRDMDEFEAKVEYYLAHEEERENMADLGYRKVHRDHTFASRCKGMLDTLAVG